MIFVSYSWLNGNPDSDVLNLVADLLNNGYDACCDKMIEQDETAIDLVEMMAKYMNEAEKVIVVLSESYKKKADSFEDGVGEEYRYIINDIKENRKKYIFVSFTEDFLKVLPDFLKGRKVLFLGEGKSKYYELFHKLEDTEQFVFPKRNPIKTIPPQIVVKGSGKVQPSNQKSVKIEPKTGEIIPSQKTIVDSGVVQPSNKKSVKIEPKVGEIIPFGNNDWRVLEVINGKALILSESVIAYKKYNKVYEGVTWETCTLRQYLNGEYYGSFSDDDKNCIEKELVVNKDNQWFGTDGGKNTNDWVFLLSLEEIVKYFGDSGQLKNKNPKSGARIDDQYNSARIAKDADDKACWWWLRSPGSDCSSAAGVSPDGGVDVSGDAVIDAGASFGGVRPALWLNL